ncbi:hypothetical protein GCM10017643_08730 [Ancylobacter dichloromethanicus]|uniref:Uncharacterized protein n=1 Tax=Ancylobacter dichloromethanicus TaxID=518825 RepID=A0A9W6J6Q8_9HYPH|nr:hypothetical protein GCM10017643_08730 [Ancylobacter dichloromethanicus]
MQEVAATGLPDTVTIRLCGVKVGRCCGRGPPCIRPAHAGRNAPGSLTALARGVSTGPRVRYRQADGAGSYR